MSIRFDHNVKPSQLWEPEKAFADFESIVLAQGNGVKTCRSAIREPRDKRNRQIGQGRTPARVSSQERRGNFEHGRREFEQLVLVAHGGVGQQSALPALSMPDRPARQGLAK